jgi:hypothetical protein
MLFVFMSVKLKDRQLSLLSLDALASLVVILFV